MFPVNGGNKVPSDTDAVSASYMAMVDEKFDEMIEFMLTDKSNVLFFCNAGKDRTGVVAAALLYKLGMCTGYIIDDYMKSKENLKYMLKEYAKIIRQQT